jgi:hypothetical protein
MRLSSRVPFDFSLVIVLFLVFFALVFEVILSLVFISAPATLRTAIAVVATNAGVIAGNTMRAVTRIPQIAAA